MCKGHGGCADMVGVRRSVNQHGGIADRPRAQEELFKPAIDAIAHRAYADAVGVNFRPNAAGAVVDGERILTGYQRLADGAVGEDRKRLRGNRGQSAVIDNRDFPIRLFAIRRERIRRRKRIRPAAAGCWPSCKAARGWFTPVVPGNLPAFGPVMIAVRSACTRLLFASSIFRIGVFGGITLPSGISGARRIDSVVVNSGVAVARKYRRSAGIFLVANERSICDTWLRYHSAPAGWTFNAPKSPSVN